MDVGSVADVALARLRDLGYRVSVGDHETRSICIPPLRRVVLRADFTGGTVDDAALLWHETTHAIRAGRGWRAWAWTLRYALDPWFRAGEEVVAEAVGLAARAYTLGAGEADIAAWAPHCHRLGGLRWPYLVPGRADRYTLRIEHLARTIYRYLRAEGHSAGPVAWWPPRR